MHYPVKVLHDDAPSLLEQLGTKEKAWFVQADNQHVLFKQGRPGTGENWAEKVSCEICSALEVPHAHYELAIWRDKQGVVSPSFVPDGFRLVLGNELLAKVVKDDEAGRRARLSLKRSSRYRRIGRLSQLVISLSECSGPTPTGS